MIDMADIRQQPGAYREAARKKGYIVDIDRIVKLDRDFRQLQQEIQDLRTRRNQLSKDIPRLAGSEKERAIVEGKEVRARISEGEPRLRRLEEELRELLLHVPSIPAPEVPEGESEEDNEVVRVWGQPPRFDFEPRDHVDLGVMLDIIDIPRAVRMAGTRSYILKNEGARLEMAIMHMAMDMLVGRGFVPMIVPVMVRREAMVGTGFFPVAEEDVYRMEKDELYLVGTSEVSLVSYQADELLDEADLPRYLAGFSACFRREAGTYGRDTRGLYRVHQFHKIEQVVICKNDAEESRRQHEFILSNSEAIARALGLHYRVALACGKETGLGQVRKHEIETWMPSRGKYSETHSCSTLHDFQARRSNIRYRDRAGQVHYVHTLNNTAVASPRILIALLETHQNKDGGVAIPEALRPYMGGMERIEPRKKVS
ncbi:MAG: serine--tRNA ligase [Deltaproteobacteria bacterium]|nr:serine--tRNA ligase [Deltaproteobacteria bacterium]